MELLRDFADPADHRVCFRPFLHPPPHHTRPRATTIQRPLSGSSTCTQMFRPDAPRDWAVTEQCVQARTRRRVTRDYERKCASGQD